MWGNILNDEHIFDLYTKWYDFWGSTVEVKSAQDLYTYCSELTKNEKRLTKQKWDIYSLVEKFMEHHPHAHYVLDEVPFLRPKSGR